MPRPLNLPLNRPSSTDGIEPTSTTPTRTPQTSRPLTAPSVPPIPERSIARNNTSWLSLSQKGVSSPPRQSEEQATSIATSRGAPPAYEWVRDSTYIAHEPLDDGPIEGEKLAALRRNDGYIPPKRSKQWRFVALGIAICVVIALVIGLAVGLTVGRYKHNDAETSESASPSASGNGTTSGSVPFPLGRYSMVTALQAVTTDCTSNPATWSCYPYTTYDQSTSASQAVFNWAISNTSSLYATVNTPSTSYQGVPANLTISTISDVLTIAITNQPLTYISPSSNTSAARYTFSFTMQKAVLPTTTITADNTAAECFFNQTTFTGTLYLSASRNYPGAVPVPNGAYTQWPYAIEVEQLSNGGTDVPACYEYENGVVGSRITSGLTPQATSAKCACDYQNF